MSDSPSPDFDIRQQIAHIDLMLTDIVRKRQEIQLAPWQVATTGMAAGAGLIVAALGLLKLFGY